MDEDGNGEISANEMTRFINKSNTFRNSGVELTLDEGWMLLERLDDDGNQRITYDELKMFVREKKPLANYVPRHRRDRRQSRGSDYDYDRDSYSRRRDSREERRRDSRDDDHNSRRRNSRDDYRDNNSSKSFTGHPSDKNLRREECLTLNVHSLKLSNYVRQKERVRNAWVEVKFLDSKRHQTEEVHVSRTRESSSLRLDVVYPFKRYSESTFETLHDIIDGKASRSSRSLTLELWTDDNGRDRVRRGTAKVNLEELARSGENMEREFVKIEDEERERVGQVEVSVQCRDLFRRAQRMRRR